MVFSQKAYAILFMILSTTDTAPLSTLSGLTTYVQQLSVDLSDIMEQVGKFQEQLVDLRRCGSRRIFTSPLDSTHLFDSQSITATSSTAKQSQDVPIEVGVGSSTPPNCVNQPHGVVRIRPLPNMESFFVFCNQKIRGGGWTSVAKRYDGSENFRRKWTDYKIGFGALTTEFFIGLEKLHQITDSGDYELLVMLENRKQDLRYALYNHFSIGSESEQYRLNVLGSYQGNASDALRQHIGKKFSTFDRNNNDSDLNCAVAQSAAYWYANSCTLSNPFGIYQRLLERDVDEFRGILWHGFLDGPKGSLKRLQMLIRPRTVMD